MTTRHTVKFSGCNGSGLGTGPDGPVRVVPWNTGVHTGCRDGLELDCGSIVRFPQPSLQLGIRILIVLQHDLYVKWAD
jgi:hypothetical protein